MYTYIGEIVGRLIEYVYTVIYTYRQDRRGAPDSVCRHMKTKAGPNYMFIDLANRDKTPRAPRASRVSAILYT